MDKVYFGVLVLTLVVVLGIIGLLALGQPVEVLVPIVSALVGFIIGRRQDNIAGAIKGAFRK